MKIYRPLWKEGTLLSPQQFQQQAAWESFRSAGISALVTPFPWGVEKIALNDSLLTSGLLQISQLRLWLDDGSLIDAQISDLPPQSRALDPARLAGIDAVTVVIALPHMQPGTAATHGCASPCRCGYSLSPGWESSGVSSWGVPVYWA